MSAQVKINLLKGFTMTATDRFKQHTIECPNCSETDAKKLCDIALALLEKIIKDNGFKV